MKLKRVNDEVFFAEGPVVACGPDEIAFLREQAARAPRLRARICAHPDLDAKVHEMLIAMHRDSWISPHRHLNRSESYHMVEGRLALTFFDDGGGRLETLTLGAPGSGDAFFYRAEDRRYHFVRALDEWAIFHETTSGPFDPLGSENAPWAPDERDAEARRLFLEGL